MGDYAPLIERAFSLELREQSYDVEEIEGQVPAFIQGTYYLNGPARFSRGGFNYRHWLDGDGMVSALRFESGRVHFTNRFVRSAKFIVEEETGRPVFRAFGTGFEQDRLKRGVMLESPVNVSVYPYRGTLLAFGEQGLPIELDPVTLETRGEFTFEGSLNDVSPFAAHPKFDHDTGDLFNFGIAYSASAPYLNFYRFDKEAKLLYRKRLSLDCTYSVHDFSLSASYAVFYLSPYLLDMRALVHDGRTLMASLRWEPERGSRLLIVSRNTGEQVAAIPIEAGYCLHLINCFEKDDELTIDLIQLDRPIYDQYQQVPDLFTNVCAGRPVRFTVDGGNQKLIGRSEIAYRLAPDFPSIDPRNLTRPYRDFWMLGISATGGRGRKFFDQLVHLSWTHPETHDVFQAPSLHYIASEPIFVADPNDETGGAVICQLFDAARAISAFAVFDAFNVGQGPVAVLRLRDPIYLGFHASFKSNAECFRSRTS